MLADDPDELKSVGLSRAKVVSLRSLAEHLEDGELELGRLPTRWTTTTLIAQLTAVKGIGEWTAQVFLVVGLAREDVLVAGDLVIRQAVRRGWGLDHLPERAELYALGEAWRPHRSTACAVLWAWARVGGPTACPCRAGGCCDAAVGGVQRGRVGGGAGRGLEGIDGEKALAVAPPLAVWLGVVPGPGGSLGPRMEGSGRGSGPIPKRQRLHSWFAENQNAPLTYLNGSLGAHTNPELPLTRPFGPEPRPQSRRAAQPHHQRRRRLKRCSPSMPSNQRPAPPATRPR